MTPSSGPSRATALRQWSWWLVELWSDDCLRVGVEGAQVSRDLGRGDRKKAGAQLSSGAGRIVGETVDRFPGTGDLSSVVGSERGGYRALIGSARPLLADEVTRHRHHGRGFKGPGVARNGKNRRFPG